MILPRAWWLLRPDARAVWGDEEVRRRLAHYRSVMEDRAPARYRVVKRMPVGRSLRSVDEGEAWELHRELSREFPRFYSEVAEKYPNIGRPVEDSFLDLKIMLVRRMLRKCFFCEWRCGVDRAAGRRGVCGLDAVVRVATAFLHLGEEAPLVPSGTIFFAGCSFRCAFCQNWDISVNPFAGTPVTPRELAGIARELWLKGARNINYVGGNPDQQLHVIVESLAHMDFNIPLLWNSNMYMTEEALSILLDIIDIWLPDFKYGSDECAWRLSRVRRYFQVVSRNHRIAAERGDMIVRHLVLPNHVDCCSRRVLEWIAGNIPGVLVNIMDQYRPEHRVLRDPGRFRDVARRPTGEEMERVYRLADRLGLVWRPVSR